MIAVYLRVSTNKQETEAQFHTITQFCRSKNYTDFEVYQDEGISGKTMNRPDLLRMLADIAQGKIQRVVTFEASRLSRDMVELMKIMDLFNKYGVTLEIPGKGDQAFESATERLLMSVQGFVAQQFLEDHSKRVAAGIAARRARDPSYQHGTRPGAKFPNRKRKHQDPSKIEKIRTLYESNLSTRKIGKIMDMSTTTVHRLINTYCK